MNEKIKNIPNKYKKLNRTQRAAGVLALTATTVAGTAYAVHDTGNSTPKPNAVAAMSTAPTLPPLEAGGVYNPADYGSYDNASVAVTDVEHGKPASAQKHLSKITSPTAYNAAEHAIQVVYAASAAADANKGNVAAARAQEAKFDKDSALEAAVEQTIAQDAAGDTAGAQATQTKLVGQENQEWDELYTRSDFPPDEFSMDDRYVTPQPPR